MVIKTLILVCFFASKMVFAGGNVENGGSVIIQNGEVILADPFVAIRGNSLTLSSELKDYLNYIRSLLEKYAIPGTGDKPYQAYGAGLWDEVFNQLTEFRYISDNEELPCDDPMDIREVNDKAVLFACTHGHVTWFRESIFRQLSLWRQALAVIHERLHAWTKNNEPHDILSDFTSIIEMMLRLQNDQINGDRRSLTDEEWEAMDRLYFRARQLSLRVGYERQGFNIVRNGGGIYYHDEPKDISTTLFVGMGSEIFASMEVGENVSIVNSILSKSARVGNSSTIVNSFIKTNSDRQNIITIGDNTTILDSDLFAQYAGGGIEIGSNSNLEKLWGCFDELIVEDTVSINGFKVEFKTLNKPVCRIGQKATLRNVAFSGHGEHFYWTDALIIPFIYRGIKNGLAPKLFFVSGSEIDMTGYGELELVIPSGITEIKNSEDLLNLRTKK